MKKTGFSKKPFALILSLVLMVSMPMSTLATTAVFGTSGAGSNPFNPRGYSIMEDVNGDGVNEHVWLQSHYTHGGLAGNVLGAQWSDTETGQYYVTSGDKQMNAWVDKGQLTSGYNMPYQRGFTTDANVDVRYFFVVSINDGPFVSVPYAEAEAKNLKDSNGNIDATQGLSAFGFATRSVVDPDGIGNQWDYPLTFTLKPGTKYTFAYLRGFAANNGMSLILSKDTTADGQTGYAGVLQGPTLTDAEKAEYAAHYQDMYQFTKSLTPLGTGVNTGKTVYSVEFSDFYHSLQTYADLTTLNSTLSDASSFADSVTDNDYKLGNYRKTSVEALKTLIDQIKAKTDLKEQLQTAVDALTKQLTDALNYAKEPAILVKGVTLDKNRADMNVGDSLTLKATLSPENADNPTISWASSDDKVATVENGVVKAVSAGDATITVTTQDGGFTATCAVEVKNQDRSTANDDNSVDVDYNTSVLPTGVSVGSVKSTAILSGTDKDNIVSALSKIGFTNLLINDVQLLDTDGNPITNLSGNVSVKIKIPDGNTSDKLSVFWYDPDTGKLTDMKASEQNGYLVFNTNHFSYYIVAKSNASSVVTENPHTSDNNMLIPFGVIAALSFTVLTVMKPYRRKKSRAE